ncbi:MAG: PAS domain-containing sensor histidine kinase [Betaproteobacteria bacterium]|nr:PAS domain-containing sensor histidine kinase [Betaproteobacteria bacterium]
MNDTSAEHVLRRPIWRQPRAIVATAVVAIVLVALNGAILLRGDEPVWLIAAAVVADMLAVGSGIVLAMREAVLAEAQSLRAQRETAQAHAAVEDMEARLAAIVDSAMDAIITINATQSIVLFNRAAEKVFRCRRDQVIGSSIERFVPVQHRAEHSARINAFANTGVTARRMGDGIMLWALRADGEAFPIESSISHTTAAGEHYYTIILRDVTLRKQTEDALRRQQQELRELSARVFEAREEEKTLIARELHDELGQLLTALKMDLAWLSERLPRNADALADKAAQMNALLDSTVGSVRRIAAELRPLMLDDLGLADAVHWLVEDFSRRSGIACRLDLDSEAPFDDVARAPATAVYRALQESLTNIARHSGARHAWVRVGLRGTILHMDVEDDGCGIDPGDVAKPRSLGLKGMRERVHYLEGTLSIDRAPRGGTRVKLSVPTTEKELNG